MRKPLFIKVLLISLILIVIFLPGYSKYQKLRFQNEQFKKQIEDYKTSNSELEKEMQMLKGNKEYIEKIAREKLGMVKKGEVVYKVIEE